MANMEKFVEAQKNLAESMVKIKNKLSEERLTRAGFDQLERNYHDSVKKLKSNHEVMMTIEPKSDDYFVKDFYGLMMNGLVKEVEEMIRSREVTVQKKSNNGSGAEGSNLGLQLERKEEFGSREEAAVGKAAMLQEKPSIRKYFFQKIERIEKRLESGEVDERDIEDSLRQLNGFYDKLLATNEIDEEVFEQYEEMTERLSIRRKVVGEQKMEKAEGKEIRSNIRLSEVRIPEFSGKIEDWESFHDLFKNLVHNSPHFSEVEKLYRLKAAIKGDAAQLIQHLKITDSNYEAAFELLKKRYENRRLMFTNLCDKILDQPVMNSDSAANIRRMLDTTKNCVMALRGMNVSTKDAEPFIARIIVRKFDKNGLRLYEQQVRKPREIQTLDDVLEFLQQQYLALEAAGEQEVNVKRIYGNKNNMSTKFCYFCEKSGHGVIECRKMLAMTPAERKPAVAAKKICFVCLLHRTDRKCNSVVRCNKCGGNHHHYLHNGDQRSVNQQVNPTSSMVIERKQQQVLLATALVKVRAATGEFELLRAMIDQGSQITSISEEASQILGLPRIKEKTEIHGLGGTLVGVSKYKVDLVIKPRFLSKHVFNSQAMVLPTIMSQQPGKSFDIDMKQWRNCMLADPFFNKSDRIDLIIGGDIYADIMEKGQKRVSGPFSQQTKLGWIVSGALSNGISKVEKVQVAATNLERFWEVEEVDAEDQCTNDDQWCMQNFEKSTVIRDDGRLMVSLPFKADMELGESKPQAMARFLNGEKKLEKYPSLKAEYITFMREYRELGHMVQVPMEMKGKYYLPHQAVIREDSRTTKVRVVFDASAKTSNQRSLNDIMHTGPKLQRDIFDIMLKWRLWKYVLTGDVEKMYRQIVVRPEDQEYQYILWRENRAEPIKQYRLTTVTYGTSAAPFLAVRSLFMIGDYCKEEMVKNIIKEDFYMDDLMTGADTVKGSQHILQSVAQQLQKFNFHLRKWISNDPKITEIVENRGRNEVISIKDDESIKTLGVGWDPNMDHFRFNVSFSHPSQMTKRKVLSLVARIFDPLGWLSPITVVAKLIVQKLWLLNIDWDETIPEEILTQWLEFANHLDSLHKIKIPRWLGTSTTTKFELHGFSDASEKAYSAVIFIKCEMRVTLLTAKSKVNPIKNKKTLPKLELCGAHLLARLLNRAEKIIGRETNVFAWTDSTITLGWIQNNRSKDKFIKNKVQDINVLVPTATWRYVGTKENPADIASRGIQPHRLMDYKLWWNGPEWLREPSSHWPELPQRTAVIASTMVTTEVNFLDDIMTRYSRFSKMRRVVAYVIRFIERTRNKIKISGGLAVHELIEAEEHILSRHQQVMFSKEIISLKRGSLIDRGSRIVGLHPFLDRRGILRVGGRLQNANMSFNQKHPIVLNKSNLTAAIVRSFHLATLHGGNRLTETSTKRKYWIIGLKAAIKKCIRSCPRCIRYKQETAKQIMGNLPDSRVTAMQPFLYTGVDYAGPIWMKCSRNRGQKCFKGYIAIFVCMSTKAIHLEAVSDLSTSAFLAALKRFFSRRGKSAKMYSDNGTNFVGAKNRLDADYKAVIQRNRDVMPVLAEEGVEWHFIPPAAPHQGGIWESGVKSVKHHLRRVIGETRLSYEEMATLLCQIEAVLNSRPLVYMDNEEVESLDFLSPSHFLIGRQTTDVPEYVNEVVGSLNKWKLIQKMRRDFWNRWKEEYLSTLQQRRRWNRPEVNLANGDVVIIKNELTHPAKWPMGRIIETHPGKDGRVRVVSLKLQDCILKRPVQKLCPLIRASDEEVEEVSPQTTKAGLRNTQSANKHVFSVLVMLLLAATSQIGAVATTGGSISEISNSTAIYLDHLGTVDVVASSWNLIIYFKLDPFFEVISKSERLLVDMRNTCGKLMTFEDHCGHVLDEMEQIVKEMIYTNRYLFHDDVARSKRAPLEFIGSLQHILFGTMDADDRKVVEENMRKLLGNQHDLKYLVQKQTSILESSVNVIRKTTEEVNSNFKSITERVNNMTEAMKEVYSVYRESIKFFMVTKELHIIISENQRVQAKIIELLIDINHGKLNPSLLTPIQLQNEIHQMLENIPESLKLPGKKHNQLSTIYKLMKAKAFIVDNQLVISAEIPLFNIHVSQIHRVIPVPVVYNGMKQIVVAREQFILYNFNMDAYHLMSELELSSCQKMSEEEYVCDGGWPWIDANDNSCEISSVKPLARHQCQFAPTSIEIFWVQLHQRNHWLFKMFNETTAHVQCKPDAQRLLKMPLQGIMKVEPGCVLRMKGGVIHAPIQFTSENNMEMKLSLYTDVESMTRWNMSALGPMTIDHGKEIELLKNQIKELKKEKLLIRGLNFHHVSGHLSLCIILTILIICSTIYLYLKCKCKRKQNIVKIDFTPHQPTEMV